MTDSNATTASTETGALPVSVRLRLALRAFWRGAVQMGRLIIGVPDYDTYVAHVRRNHPERTPMSYEAFFAERQAARYKAGGGRCC